MHTIHLFPKSGVIYGGDTHSKCCGKTWAEITDGQPKSANTYSKNPNLDIISKDGVWCTGKVSGIGVNTQGKKYTVHLFPHGQAKPAACCEITYPQLGMGNGHLQTPNSDWNDITSTMGKCPGWPHGEIVDAAEEQPINPKVTCMICGWPRIPKGAGHPDGTPIQEGEVIPKDLYIDGKLVKIFCEKHCNGCGQPTDTCHCCMLCHHYPCNCGQKPKKAPVFKNSGSALLTMHVKPPNSPKTLCCHTGKDVIDANSLHDYTDEYADGALSDGYKWCSGAHNTQNVSGDIHGFYFDLPQQYKCYACGKHMKNCDCENGPVDKKGGKLSLTTFNEGKLVTVATGCMVPGWISRGQIPVLKQTNADIAWPNMQPSQHDPVEWAADFYLYNAIVSGGVNVKHECDGPPCHHNISQMFALENPPVRSEARILLHQVVAEADLVFREYIDMACGGELRHHASVGGKGALSGTRSTAWAQWRDVRDLVGVRAILDMAELFVDCNSGTGGVCGQRWQQAALLLYGRLTGKVKPEVFVDQVFSLVHNGGVFLNKREWKNSRLSLLQGTVLPAQARDDFATLLDYASPTAVEVWSDAWKAINYCRIRVGVPPTRREVLRSIQVCSQCSLASFQGHRFWDCRKAITNRVTTKHDIAYYRTRRTVPHYDWGFKKFWLYDHGDGNGPWYYSNSVSSNSLPAAELLDKTFTVPEGKRTLMISDGDYNILKLPITKFKGQEWKLRDLIELHGLKVSILNQHGMEVDA